MSSKSVLQECQVGVSQKKCQARVSSKSVLQECQVRVSSKKGVLQECHPSVSRQGVPQVGSRENVINKYCFCPSTYVSAFGFVGFILFFSRMRSEGSRFTWGSGCEAVFAKFCVCDRNRSQPSATVGNRSQPSACPP